MEAIVIEAAPVETIPVTLVGKKYTITPPKSAFALRIARQARDAASEKAESVISVMDEWIVRAFGETKAKEINKRLDDPKDALDIPHIMQLMERIIEVQSDGDPTS